MEILLYIIVGLFALMGFSSLCIFLFLIFLGWVFSTNDA